jgi:pilus assembly protein CpaC
MVLFMFATAASWLAPAAQAQEAQNWLDIELGKSTVLETPRNPTAVAITDPEVANVVSLGIASKLQVQGVAIGTTDLIVQYGPGVSPDIYEITVSRDLSDLVRRIDSIVEGEPPRVYPLGERIVVEGDVDDLDTLEQVALVARVYDEDFVNLMRVRGDHQVQLELIFAEVSRTAARDLGLNVLYGDSRMAFQMTGPTPNFTNAVQAPGLADTYTAGLVPGASSGGYNITGVFTGAVPIAAVLSMVDDYKMGKLLAQTTLTSLSGQQAEFLAGGEIPIPIPSTSGRVSIEYKQYGVLLAFVPTVLANDIIDVRMQMEVSEPDYGNSTRIASADVPGFISRKGKSHLRIQSGMTFAVAGLLNERTRFIRAGVPVLGRIPLIGMLFRTVEHSRDETELVVYITPRLVRPLAPGEVPAAPGTTENNNPSDFELFVLGMDHRPGSRTMSPTGAVGLQR